VPRLKSVHQEEDRRGRKGQDQIKKKERKQRNKRIGSAFKFRITMRQGRKRKKRGQYLKNQRQRQVTV